MTKKKQASTKATPQRKKQRIKDNIPRCPKCNEVPTGTVEIVEGIAQINFDAEGKAEYGGYTDIQWDSQKSMRDNAERVQLWCGSCFDQYPAPDGWEVT